MKLFLNSLLLLLCLHSNITSSFNPRFPNKVTTPFQPLALPDVKRTQRTLSIVSVSLFICTITLTHQPLPSISATPVAYVNKVTKTDNPTAVGDIMRDRYAELRAGVTGEKINELRVGTSLVARLRNVDTELDSLQQDLYKDDEVDWEVLKSYIPVLRAYGPLFTAYTDRAFPSDTQVDVALRYALRYEVGGFFTGLKDLESAIDARRIRTAQRAYSKISVAYDHYLKAGDLYEIYEEQNCKVLVGGETVPECWEKEVGSGLTYNEISTESYIAPGIEAPAISDKVVVLIGPDKGRTGSVLWISKGASVESSNVIIKLDVDLQDDGGIDRHKEIRVYPYQYLAKTTSPSGLFIDNLIAAYIASAISSGIMYPIDSFKTRMQAGKTHIFDKL